VRRVRRGKMDLLRFYLPHDSTGKISTHKAASQRFGFGVRVCVLPVLLLLLRLLSLLTGGGEGTQIPDLKKST